MNKKIKILEICPYSSGICGVWQRVKQEAIELKKKGYNIEIFSSNIIKGTKNKTDKKHDEIDKIKITRFPAKKLGGESYMHWDFEKEAIKYNPDLIFVHNYRHLHTTKALKIVKKLNKKCKIVLITQAPFVRKGTTRTFLEDVLVDLYDKIIGPMTLKKFDWIVRICDWELPFLKKMGCDERKIIKIQNGFPNTFFNTPKKSKSKKQILFLGRIHPVKNVELLIKSMNYFKNIKLNIVGYPEKDYKQKLDDLIIKKNMTNVNFIGPIYPIKEKIDMIDKHDIMVLPSIREAQGAVILEAMARKKIVIASDTDGPSEIIKNNFNGFIFKSNNLNSLNKAIKKALNLTKSKKEQMQKNAYDTAKEYNWNNLIKKYEKIIND